MISLTEESEILSLAYVPEHIISLMVLLSKGEPFFFDDFLCYKKDNWLIFIGYPLKGEARLETIETLLTDTIGKFKPQYVWYIGKEIPPSFGQRCAEKNRDQYYKIDLESFEMKKNLERMVQRAKRDLKLERAFAMTRDHDKLIDEFIKREKPDDWIKALFKSMPAYVSRAKSVMVLNARDQKGNLSAFDILELGAKEFATYVVGCHSKKHYVPQASDLLLFEMINIAKGQGKKSINLGLGVNDGIRRFKEKWGGVPFLDYQFCEVETGFTRPLSFMKALEGKL